MSLDEVFLKRYSILLITGIAIVFVWLSPIYWREVQVNRGAIPEAFENSELYQFVYPSLEYIYGRIRRGEIPLWNPYQLCGTPIVDDPRLAVFHPFSVVFLFLPVPQAMVIHSFICLIFMGVGFCLFLRSMGLSYLGSFTGAIVYTFSGASGAAMCRPGPAAALATTPFCFWLLWESGIKPDRRLSVILGMCYGFLLLSGVFAWAFLVAVVSVLFVIVGSFTQHSYNISWWVKRFGLAIGLALLLSAIQWIPTVISMREWAEPFKIFWGMDVDAQTLISPRSLLTQLFLSRPGALPRIGYVGIGTLLIIPSALFHYAHRREVAFFSGLLAVLFGIYGVLWGKLPFSFPSHALVYMMVVSIGVLSGIGLDRLLLPPRVNRIPAVWYVGLVFLLISVLLFGISSGQIRGYVLAMVIFVLPALVFRNSPVRLISGLLVALFLFIDLTVASVNAYRHPFTEAPGYVSSYRDAWEQARVVAGDGRIFISARELESSLFENLGMLLSIPSIGGAYLPVTKAQRDWWRRLTDTDKPLLATSGKGISSVCAGSKLLNLMSARVVLAAPQSPLYEGKWQTAQAPQLSYVASIGNIRLWLNKDALPRVYWVPKIKKLLQDESVVEMLLREEFDPSVFCIVKENVGVWGVDTLESLPAGEDYAAPADAQKSSWTCQIEKTEPEYIMVRVLAAERGMLVLTDTYREGWFAYVDGEKVPIFCVNGLFRGVVIPEGEHVVEFLYRPGAFVAGAGTSVVGVLVFLMMLLMKNKTPV